MVSDRAFTFHVCIPCGKTFIFVSGYLSGSSIWSHFRFIMEMLQILYSTRLIGWYFIPSSTFFILYHNSSNFHVYLWFHLYFEMALKLLFLTLSQQALVFTIFTMLQYKSFENTGKIRNCVLGAISPFPIVFSTYLENFLPFLSNSKCHLQTLLIWRV